ncbi:MAG TPA: TlpA disulfide reductase family protein [Gammaproteobacteria bacterium]|nr:TlpA disulfide reductase family protein [Gammaproteobacteria bacterium]
MARSRPVLLTVALSAAAVLGFVAYRTFMPTPATEGADEGPATSAALTVETLPDFSLGNLAGEQQSIQSWPGKPLLINFWATWCGPCLREIPMLKELQTARPDLQIVGIAIDKRDLVVGFAANTQFNYPILIGQAEAWAAAAALGVNIYALPFTVFTAADGSILGVHTGELHAEHLEAFRTIADDLKAGTISVAEARGRIAAGI